MNGVPELKGIQLEGTIFVTFTFVAFNAMKTGVTRAKTAWMTSFKTPAGAEPVMMLKRFQETLYLIPPETVTLELLEEWGA